jgi:hypothetical protein
MFGVLISLTIRQLNALCNNPNIDEITEIEIIDPMHPLFGRRMALLSVSRPIKNSGYAFVSYQEHMALKIPVSATNLVLPKPIIITKFTAQSLAELLSLAKQCEVLCPPIQEKSGKKCREKSKTRSLKNSRRSARR